MIQKNAIGNVVTHAVGYADKPGTLPFFVPEDSNHGAGSFSADSLNTPGETIQLPLVPGDDHLQKAGVKRIDLMKMDIQGYEKPALEGLRQTLTRDRPIVIMELIVLKKEKLGFFSEQELRGAYPPNYTFFRIGRTLRTGFTHRLWGHHTLFCWDTKQPYRLTPFDMKFEDNGTHTNLLAVLGERIEELKSLLPSRFE